jgi:hypothetical protein
MQCRLCRTLVVAAAMVAMGAGIALAQTQTDVYKVNYFSNNLYILTSGGVGFPPNLPTADVRITNPGLTYGNLCAMIYVFDQDQQMTECCGCSVSHNGLLTLTVPGLTLNPLTGVVSHNGVIKVVSAAVNDSPCDPTANVKPTANLRVWVTHIQSLVRTAYPVTETESSDSALGATELANLQAQCSFVNILGSGHGICGCGSGETGGGGGVTP